MVRKEMPMTSRAHDEALIVQSTRQFRIVRPQRNSKGA